MVGVEVRGGNGAVVSMMEVKSNKSFAIVCFVQLSAEFELTLTILIILQLAIIIPISFSILVFSYVCY